MSQFTKWTLLVVFLVVATIATGGLDLVAVSLAGGLWAFFTRSK